MHLGLGRTLSLNLWMPPVYPVTPPTPTGSGSSMVGFLFPEIKIFIKKIIRKKKYVDRTALYLLDKICT